MRCKNCGAELIVKNGICICESCGITSEISAGYEFFDVYIAYIESDIYGRRTKDSIIGQEIYKKLENAKIKTYFQRVSASKLSGEEYEVSSMIALDSAKVVVIIGTTPQYFERLSEKYKDGFAGKKVVPVYSDMKAYDIPDVLKDLQALNYNFVGAVADLLKNTAAFLGRGADLDIISEAEKKTIKKKKIVFVFLLSALMVILGICTYFIFGTTYVLPIKKYEQAQSFIEEERYSDAVILLNKISDYKNSSSLIADIYGRYVGYYESDDKAIGFHMSVIDNIKANIEITRKVEGFGIIKIIENAQIVDNSISLWFNDSENNQGEAVIVLENEGISLNVSIDGGEIIEAFFDINEKSDKPISDEITATTIKNWLKKRTTENDLKALGYEVLYEYPLYKDPNSGHYGIENTEIKVALINYDIYRNYNETDDGKNKMDEPRFVFGFSAPANILIPEKIGESKLPYVENDILYVPDGRLAQANRLFDFYVNSEGGTEVITDEMIVCCTSREVLGDELWNDNVREFVYELRVEKYAVQEYGDRVEKTFGIRAEGENNTHYLYSVEIINSGFAILYKINKDTFSVEYITDVYFDDNLNEAFWQIFPELVDEFPIDYDSSY